MKDVDAWEEADLHYLPDEESDKYEYKSSQITDKKLKQEIGIAASAFWNSGGGIFVAGVNNNGDIDGGISETVGRQSRRDWADQIIGLVRPPGPYTISTISGQNNNSAISLGNVVLLISFGESMAGPHMAPDYKYYIRAGAHSSPASHYLVEAIRARQGLQHPRLRGVLQMHPQKAKVIQLVVLNLNNAPALDVKLSFQPLPKGFAEHYSDLFPLTIPVISREQAFRMDVSVWGLGREIFGEKPVTLRFDYTDIVGRDFEEEQILHLKQNVGPIQMEPQDEALKALENMVQEVKGLRVTVEKLPEQLRPYGTDGDRDNG